MENTQALSLTSAQRRLLDHLRRRARAGLAPASLDELCKELGLASRGSLHKQVSALVDAGLVAPMDGKQRGVRLCDTEEGSLPLLGRIAAGRPIEALAGSERVSVPAQLRPRGDAYALEVRGDSMRDAGIHDGDVVIVEARPQSRAGDIVVALIDGDSATLKRMRRRGGDVELLPDNPDFEIQRYPAERVQIQGVVVGLMRRY